MSAYTGSSRVPTRGPWRRQPWTHGVFLLDAEKNCFYLDIHTGRPAYLQVGPHIVSNAESPSDSLNSEHGAKLHLLFSPRGGHGSCANDYRPEAVRGATQSRRKSLGTPLSERGNTTYIQRHPTSPIGRDCSKDPYPTSAKVPKMKIYPGQVGTAMGATGPQFGQPRSPRAVSASSEVRGSLEAGSALFEGFWYRPRVPPTSSSVPSSAAM